MTAAAEITLDDVPLPTPAGATVGAVLGEVRRAALPAGRIITSLSINGDHLIGDALDESLSRLMSDVRDLVIHSEEGIALVLSTLRAARAAVPDMQALRERIADLLTAGDADQGTRLIGELTRAWSDTVSAVDGCAELMGVPTATEVSPRAGPPVISLSPSNAVAAGNVLAATLPRVRQALVHLHDALTDGDIVRLADQMRYELGATLDHWQDVMSAMMHAADTCETQA